MSDIVISVENLGKTYRIRRWRLRKLKLTGSNENTPLPVGPRDHPPLPRQGLAIRAQTAYMVVMKSAEVTVRFPAGLEAAVQTTPEELSQQIRLMAALKMFELGKLSSGKAAELAGLTRAEFFDACARYKVSVFNYPPEEVAAEMERDVETAAQVAAQ